MSTQHIQQPHSESSTVSAGRSLITAFGVFIFLSAVLGIVYPAVMTGAAQLAMPDAANGSTVFHQGRAVGSRLIGQDWSDTGLFEGRPSAAGYNARSSSGSNQAMTNPDLQQAMRDRAERWQRLTGSNAPVPADLLTASGSGLDPAVSLSAARYQVPYVSRSTGVDQARLEAIIDETAREPLLGMSPEPLVNVLELNLRVMEAAGLEAETVLARAADRTSGS